MHGAICTDRLQLRPADTTDIEDLFAISESATPERIAVL
jgi:hypothetical protein